jgi:quercetin dioxygenase-like cupin family protein
MFFSWSSRIIPKTSLRIAAARASRANRARSADRSTTSEMKWVDTPEAKGAQQAVVLGNPQKGAHSSFAKFAGGTELPMHTHTAGSGSIVIAGTMLEGLEGQQPKELGPGSYFYIPGELKHTTACKAGADCIIYTDWQGAFDMKPATP